MKKLLLLLINIPMMLSAQYHLPASSSSKEELVKQVNEQFNRKPAAFRQNKGQWEDAILFQGGAGGANVNFLKNALSFGYKRKVKNTNLPPFISKDEEELHEAYQYFVFNLNFVGANSNIVVSGKGQTDSKVNYLIGNDFSRHAANVPDYEQVSYENVYPNIDLHYYNLGKELKYDYVLKPGAKIDHIRMSVEGINGLVINQKGQLELNTVWGTLIEKAPYSYQLINGSKVEVDIRFQLLENNTYGFKAFGKYDPSKELVIDPILFEWSTFIAAPTIVGIQTGYVRDIVLDKDQFVYGVGFYRGDRFPTTPGVYDPTFDYPAGIEATVFKLSPDGSQLIWSTFIGGNDGSGWGRGIALNDQKEVFICGYTGASTFPVTPGAFDASYNGGNADFFMAKLSANGASLLYSTFVGGSGYDHIEYSYGGGMVVNAAGEAFMTGSTLSGDFPTTAGAYDQTYNGGGVGGDLYGDVAVVKLNATGTGLVYSTFIGGQLNDEGRGIAINAAGEAYITGSTGSVTPSATPNNFPVTAGAYDVSFNDVQDVFVAKLNASGNSLLFCTYIGGNAREQGNSIKLTSAGEIYVAGITTSKDFPVTPGVFKPTSTVGLADAADGFVFRMSPDAAALLNSSFIGGKSFDYANDLKVSAAGEVFVVGGTASTNLPFTSCAFDNTYSDMEDGYLAKLTSTLSAVEYFTIFGGPSNDYRERVAIIEEPCVTKAIVSLSSHSPDFPVTPGAYQEKRATDQNGVPTGQDVPTIFRLKAKVDPDFTSVVGQCGSPTQFTDKTTGNCIWKFGAWLPTSWKWDFGDGITSTDQNPSHTYSAPGTYQVKLVVSCPKDSIIKTVVIPDPFQPLSLGPDQNFCLGEPAVTLDAGAQPAGVTYTWSNGATTQNITVSQSGPVWVEIKNGSCTKRDSVLISYSPPPAVLLKDSVLCEGMSLTLDAGNPGATYVWSTNETTQSINVSTNATYSVTVSRGNCKSTGSMTATFTPIPVVNIKDTAACTSAPLVLDAGNPGKNYDWSTNEHTRQISVTETGKYWVTVTDGFCKNTDTVLVTISDPPVLILNDTVVCSGIPVTLDALNPGCTYLWSTNATTQTITASNADTYWVTVTKGNCSITEGVKVDYINRPVIDLGNDTTICQGGPITLDAQNPGSSYVWSTGATTSTIGVAQSGDYWVTVAVGSCTESDTITITYNEAPELGPNASLCEQEEVVLDAGRNTVGNYLWSTEATTRTIKVQESGTYWVRVTNGLCMVTDTVQVTGEFGFPSLFIPNSFTPNGDDLNEHFFAVAQDVSSFDMKIFNRWGELYFHSNDINQAWDGTYKGTVVQEDVYVWIVRYKTLCGTEELNVRRLGHVSVIR